MSTKELQLIAENVTVDELNTFDSLTGKSLLVTTANENNPELFDSIVKKVFELNGDKLSKIKGTFQEILKRRLTFLQNEYNAGYSRLHVAVIDDEPDVVRYILNNNLVDPNCSDVPIGTALHLAILLNRVRCIEALIEFDVNVDIVNRHQQTALEMAFEAGICSVFPRLLYLSKKIDQPTPSGMTFLQMAVLYDWQSLIGLLLDAGADIFLDFKKPDDVSMITMIASVSSRIPILPLSSIENSVTLYLKFNGDLDSRFHDYLDFTKIRTEDGHGNSLLHLAASLFNIELCKLLLGRGADVNFINHAGKNPLQEMFQTHKSTNSSIKKFVTIGTALINSGTLVDMSDSEAGNITKDILALNHEKFFLLCIENATNIDYAKIDFKSIVKRRWFNVSNMLILSMPKTSIDSLITDEVVQLYSKHAPICDMDFLLSQCSEDLLNQIMPSILDELATKNEIERFQILLKVSVPKPMLLSNGETLLTNLMRNGKQEFIDKLLDSSWREVSINLNNGTGQSPLHVAIEMRYKTLIEIFLFEHRDLNLRETNGETIFSLLFKSFDRNGDSVFVEKIAKIMITAKANPSLTDSNNIPSIDYCVDPSVKSRIISFDRKKKAAGSRATENSMECKICLSNPVECVLDCGHVYCEDCAKRCNRCPTCRMPSTTRRKIFL